MFEELSEIVKDRIDPAAWMGILTIATALEKHQATLWKEHIFHLGMDANQHDPASLADEARRIIYVQVRALLEQMQITLDIDALPMATLAAIIEALLFNPSDDDRDIAAVLEAGEEGVDVLCDILAIQLNCLPEELMEFVLEVSSATILAIHDRVNRNLEYSTESVEGVQDTTRLINHHQTIVGTQLTIGMESLQGGTAVGVAPLAVLAANSDRLLSATPERMADELISIALLAKTPRDALEDEVMHLTESMVDDPFVVMGVLKQVVKRLKELPEVTP